MMRAESLGLLANFFWWLERSILEYCISFHKRSQLIQEDRPSAVFTSYVFNVFEPHALDKLLHNYTVPTVVFKYIAIV